MTRFPQRYRVLQLALERLGRGFTRWDAANDVACFELASRIGELEAEGVEFNRETEAIRNRYGDTVRHMRYDLAYAPPSLVAHVTLRKEQEA